MKGAIDSEGRALLPIRLRESGSAVELTVEAWIDTGFTGELVLPQLLANQLGLAPGLAIRATLADGSEVILDTFSCMLEWYGEWKLIEIIVNSGQFPLMGVGLLRGKVLHADYLQNTLELF